MKYNALNCGTIPWRGVYPWDREKTAGMTHKTIVYERDKIPRVPPDRPPEGVSWARGRISSGNVSSSHSFRSPSRRNGPTGQRTKGQARAVVPELVRLGAGFAKIAGTPRHAHENRLLPGGTFPRALRCVRIQPPDYSDGDMNGSPDDSTHTRLSRICMESGGEYTRIQAPRWR